MFTPGDLHPDLFIPAVRADRPGKQGLTVELIAHRAAVADVTRRCVEVGELQRPVGQGLMTAE